MSPLHSSAPISLRCGNFSDSTINKGYIAYFCTAHALNSHISTAGLKSDITIKFLDSNFLQGVGISAIRVHWTQL